jgi:transglutaminase-like putative cysteine protease
VRDRLDLGLPGTALVAGLAALTAWVTLLVWSPFAERPSTFLVPLAFGALLVAVSGLVLRAARLHPLLVLLVQLLVVALWLHHRLAGPVATWGWLPNRLSLETASLAFSDAAEVARTYAAPVPAEATAFAPLMIVAGMGMILLVDFIACTLRRAPVAGLPLLAAYTAPISILDGGVPWAKFAAGALCFLFLIAAQEAARLAQWGRQVSDHRMFDSQSTEVSSQAVWSSARKIGVTATGLSVLVPLLVPTLSLELFDGFGNGPGGNGDSVSLTNPMADMRRDLARGLDIDLITVRTDDPDPTYLRVTVLDRFDGDSWRPSEREIPRDQTAQGLLPRPPGLDDEAERDIHDWDVSINDEFESNWLPVPYPAHSLEAPGDWRYDLRTMDFIAAVNGLDTRNQSYRLQSLRVSPTAQQLATSAPVPATVFQPMTELPDLPVSITRLALSITRDQPTKFEQAVALQRWFRVGGGFEYSLARRPGNGLSELEDFLLTDKQGYCEQFATAMATMGRALKIPSRVAVGFLRPTSTDGGASYTYSTHDLHAWPEMYFEGTGWVRFEPTPAVQAPTVPSYTRGTIERDEPDSTTSSRAVAPSQNRIDAPSASAAAGSGGGGGGIDLGSLVRGAGVLLLVALVLVVPRLVRALVRRRRWAAATSPVLLAEASWAELRDTARDLGVAWDDTVTVRSRARELVRSFGRPGGDEDAITRAESRGEAANPDAARSLERLVRLVELARYAREVPPSAAEVDATRADVARCVEALRAGASRRARTRADWLPASLLAPGVSTTGPRRPLRFDDPGVDRAV